jgi:hypothetical protein
MFNVSAAEEVCAADKRQQHSKPSLHSLVIENFVHIFNANHEALFSQDVCGQANKQASEQALEEKCCLPLMCYISPYILLCKFAAGDKNP